MQVALSSAILAFRQPLLVAPLPAVRPCLDYPVAAMCPAPTTTHRSSCIKLNADPPPLSSTLLILDASVLILYSLSVSIWMLLITGEGLDTAHALQLDVDLRDIVLELNSALSIAFGWCIGGSLGGACDQEVMRELSPLRPKSE